MASRSLFATGILVLVFAVALFGASSAGYAGALSYGVICGGNVCTTTSTLTSTSTVTSTPSTTVYTTSTNIVTSSSTITVQYTSTSTATTTATLTTTQTVGTQTSTSTILANIEGYLSINGAPASGTISVYSPTLSFVGTISNGGQYVNYMQVCVQDSTGAQVGCTTLNPAGGNQFGPGTFTLPSAGVYTLIINIELAGTTSFVYLFSLTANHSGNVNGPGFTVLNISYVLAAVGAGLLILGVLPLEYSKLGYA